jgi:hypothetical protein
VPSSKNHTGRSTAGEDWGDASISDIELPRDGSNYV